MNISKINAVPSFKGYLAIEHDKGGYYFDTNEIVNITDNARTKTTKISGYDIHSQKPINIIIPYKTISPSKIISAYTAACQNSKTQIMLLTNKENITEN